MSIVAERYQPYVATELVRGDSRLRVFVVVDRDDTYIVGVRRMLGARTSRTTACDRRLRSKRQALTLHDIVVAAREREGWRQATQNGRASV